jgi:EAL domain-containing protein (putative c-di-GMP-specific phosphodiesterase class I)
MKSLFDQQGRVGLDRVVELAHRHLGLDVVYIAELTGGKRVCRAVAGDATSFGFTLDDGPPADGSYSQLLVTGAIANVIPDTSAHRLVAALPGTTTGPIGAFIGVPLLLSDGTFYGTLCGMDHEPDHTLTTRDVRFMTMLAELIVYDLDEQRRQRQLRLDLTGLIDADGIEIALQPIIGLRSGACLGVEALARFPEPFAKTEQTFGEAESVGLGLELERLAVREAWKVLPLLGPEQFLAINLSPDALVELAGRAQRRDDLPLESLVIEVTEQSVVRSYPELREALAPLRTQGLRVAIDDAGAGYASLHHIVELRPDFIKVDRSLVHGLADDDARRVAVSAFVLLSWDLGGTVVAEGVERPQDLAAVRDLGVQAAQGFLLGKPSTNREHLAQWTAPAPPWARNPALRRLGPTVIAATLREEAGPQD